MPQAVLIVLSYFFGAIPFGVLVGKVFRGIDIRDYGSGNIGATNVLRTLGKPLAFLVGVCDTLKGYAAVELAKALIPGEYHYQWAWVIVAGLVSIVGHTASPFLKFKGGKGVATSLGVIIGLNPVIAATAFSLWVVLVAVTRYVSIASIVASASVPVMMFLSRQLFHFKYPVPTGYAVFSLAAALLILIRHRSNIVRLLQGKEPKFGQKVKLEGEDSNGRDEPVR